MNQIDRLTDDCLQQVFEHLPINQLLSLRFVSPRWKRLIKYRNKHQVSLKLFLGKNELDAYQKNDHFYYQLKSCPYFRQNNDFMIVPHLNYLICQFLLREYPNLKMLLISGCQFQECDLIMLLKELKKLECLSLIFCNMASDDDSRKVFDAASSIFFVLDKLPLLKHFAMSLASELVMEFFGEEFLHRIEELHLHNVPIDFKTYWPISPCVRDSFENNQFGWKKFAAFNESRKFDLEERFLRDLSKNMKHLTVTPLNCTILDSVCTHFGSLHFLDVHLEYGLDLKYLYSLNKLPNLQEFRLRTHENGSIFRDESDENGLSLPIMSVKSLHLDIDFEPSIFAILPQIFPSVNNLTLNASRVCCKCPATVDNSQNNDTNHEHPEQERPANQQVDQQQPLNNHQNANENPQPAPEVRLRANEAVDNVEFELDNCTKCFEQTMLILKQWKSLSTLSIIGNRCKEEAMDPLKSMPGLQSLSLANCEKVSLLPVINICYQIAKSRPVSVPFILRLNFMQFKKIIPLSLKPDNLFVYNVSPITDLEDEFDFIQRRDLFLSQINWDMFREFP